MAEKKFTEDEYELLPHKEIEELKRELQNLKEFEITPSKKMQVSVLELNKKLDKLLTIFEDASHQVKVEEGGLSFAEKMTPLLEKMNKILEQNAEIASGILAVADMVKEVRGGPVRRQAPKMRIPPGAPRAFEPIAGPPIPPPPRTAPPRAAPPVAPPRPPVPPAPMRTPTPPTPPIPLPVEAPATGPPLPPLPRKRTFGL